MDVLHQAQAARRRAGRRVLGAAARAAREPRAPLARAGRGHLGGPRAAAPLHALEGDGVGGVRPRPSRRSRSSGATATVDRWRRVRDEIHAEVLERGYDDELGSFVQSYDSKRLDASLLMIPLFGFLPADDARVRGTLDAVAPRAARRRVRAALPPRRGGRAVDGLPPGEGAFFLCSFWFVDNLVLLGELDEAREMFERLLALRNDLGLLSEEYDPRLAAPRRQLPAGVLAHRADQHRAAAREGAGGERRARPS